MSIISRISLLCIDLFFFAYTIHQRPEVLMVVFLLALPNFIIFFGLFDRNPKIINLRSAVYWLRIGITSLFFASIVFATDVASGYDLLLIAVVHVLILTLLIFDYIGIFIGKRDVLTYVRRKNVYRRILIFIVLYSIVFAPLIYYLLTKINF